MAAKENVMAQLISLVWLVLGAASLGVITRTVVPPLTWIALLFLLHGSRSMTPLVGAGLLWAAIYIVSIIANRGIVPAAGPTYFVINVFTTTILVLPFVLDRFAATGRFTITATLVFPAAFVAAEFLRSRFAPPATWGSIAYTQGGDLPLMQLAAITGIWGLTFVIAWFASTFELAWSAAIDWTTIRTPLVVYCSTLGVILLGGSVRLALAPTDRPSMRVSTLNRPVDLFVPGEMTRVSEGSIAPSDRERMRAKLSHLHDWFLEGSRREAAAGARLIVWPEQNLLVFKEDEAAFLEKARRLAAEEHVYLAMGLGTIHLGERLPFENKLIVVDPHGTALMSYLKSHPVKGWEESIMRVGDGRLPVVATEEGRIAGAICFDASFPEFIRQAAEKAGDVLIVPVNDWKEIKTVHFDMHAFRAIETGIPLVRAAASGLSGAFDPWGRVLGVADYFAPGDRTMTAQVPLGRIPTLYALTGDVFAWGCVMLTAMAIGGSVLAAVRA